MSSSDNRSQWFNARYLRNRARKLPWWAILLAALLAFSVYKVVTTDQYRDILDYMMDSPVWKTEDRYSVVYEVKREVLVVSHTLSLRLADGSRLDIDANDVIGRDNGTLPCDKEANPDCVSEFGEIITYRVLSNTMENAAGTVQMQGILRPIGNIVDLPNGQVVILTAENIISQAEGTLTCNHIVTPDCEDMTGTVVTFNMPYIEQQGLLAREDVVIRFVADGFERTVRPNRVSDIRAVACEGESSTCHNSEAQYGYFGERVIGTEVEKTDKSIRVRTVDEQVEVIPTNRIISRKTGLVECNKDASPRCEDFEGTIIERRGTFIAGQLTLENNRALSIIPEGLTTAIEINKTDVASEDRNPEDCRPEDETACFITVQEADDVVGGELVSENSSEITLRTVAPVFEILDRNLTREISRVPQVCAFNNIRGCNEGIWLTLFVTFVSYGLALFIGLIVGLMRVSSNPFFYHFSTLYVELLRGTPLLVLLLFFAFVVGPLIRDTDAISFFGLFDIPIGKVTHPPYNLINDLEVRILGRESFLSEAVLGLAIGYGAFLAEVFRAGIQSIGRGQMEAARSLGMSYWQAMRHVILPQAIRIVLPPLGNDFIAMLKDSALISVLALPDLLQNGRLYISRTFQPIPVYVVVAVLYVVLTLVLSAMVRYMERRMKMF